MKKKKRTQWHRLDNAAKIFPATSGKKDTKVFRIACELNEQIKEENLSEALEQTLHEFPVFRSVLRRGFFWYYLETTEKKAKVHIENKQPCSPIYDSNKRGLLFDVSYFGRRINLEVHHALTDGTGAYMFLSTLVSRYLLLSHPTKLFEKDMEFVEDTSISQRSDDSFSRYYDDRSKESHIKEANNYCKRSFRLHGSRLSEHRIKVVEGHVSVSEIKKLAKQYHTTITVYLTALLFASIGEVMTVREKRRPVGMMVPVNLRSYFESTSVRNFFGTIDVFYDFGKRSGEFEDIIHVVEQSFQEQLTKDKMEQRLNQFGSLGNHIAARIVPLIIKDFFIRIAHYLSDRKYTFAISNIGKISMPEVLERYIRLFSVFVSTTKKQVCICSYEDTMVISFTSPLIETDVERNFFRKLTQQGISVRITTTTGWED